MTLLFASVKRSLMQTSFALQGHFTSSALAPQHTHSTSMSGVVAENRCSTEIALLLRVFLAGSSVHGLKEHHDRVDAFSLTTTRSSFQQCPALQFFGYALTASCLLHQCTNLLRVLAGCTRCKKAKRQRWNTSCHCLRLPPPSLFVNIHTVTGERRK